MRKSSLMLCRLLSITGSFLVILSSLSLGLPDIPLRCVLALAASLIVSIKSSEKSLWISALIGCWTLFIGLRIGYTTGGQMYYDYGIPKIVPNIIYIVFIVFPSLLMVAAPMYYRASRSDN